MYQITDDLNLIFEPVTFNDRSGVDYTTAFDLGTYHNGRVQTRLTSQSYLKLCAHTPILVNPIPRCWRCSGALTLCSEIASFSVSCNPFITPLLH
jgi:hypothetical protein